MLTVPCNLLAYICLYVGPTGEFQSKKWISIFRTSYNRELIMGFIAWRMMPILIQKKIVSAMINRFYAKLNYLFSSMLPISWAGWCMAFSLTWNKGRDKLQPHLNKQTTYTHSFACERALAHSYTQCMHREGQTTCNRTKLEQPFQTSRPYRVFNQNHRVSSVKVANSARLPCRKKCFWGLVQYLLRTRYFSSLVRISDVHGDDYKSDKCLTMWLRYGATFVTG